jgi:hypothetical protein
MQLLIAERVSSAEQVADLSRPRYWIVSAVPLDRTLTVAVVMPAWNIPSLNSADNLSSDSWPFKQSAWMTKYLGTHSAGIELNPYAFQPTSSEWIVSRDNVATPVGLIQIIGLRGSSSRSGSLSARFLEGSRRVFELPVIGLRQPIEWS